jgi:hypothetical protein
MTAALRYVPLEWRFVLLACAGAVLVLGCGIYVGLQLHAPTITRTQQVVHAPATGAALAAAWGTPDQSVAGAQISPSLKGLTCDVWQARKAILCIAP